MKAGFESVEENFHWLGTFLLPIILFWLILNFEIPYSLTRTFQEYSLGMFLIVLVFYYLAFRLSDPYRVLAGLGVTMLLFALTLSYKWTSGYSDNFVMGGLLPYKDAKNYYVGSHLLLDGLPLIKAGQATERPLFPGFLAFVLLLTDQNLKIALAVIAQLVGIGIYLSARQIRNAFGGLAASVFATFLYFYIQPLIGYSLSESLGFIGGCLGFTIIWFAAYSRKWIDLLLGITVLMVAVSARAGAFFIFPMLVLWIGWIFRGETWFSWRAAFFATVIVLSGYFLANSIYSRLLGIPPGYSFGNFSYTLYGQVRGGLGWHTAIEELGTRNPSLVYRAAWEFFLAHPISLFTGFVKSYRDFFWLGDRSIFPFSGNGWQYWPGFVLWLGTLIILLRGIFHLFKSAHSNSSSLLVACFMGIFLSIPFLPPIDGGSRFYAGSMPFFLVLPAVGLWSFFNGGLQDVKSSANSWSDLVVTRSASVILLASTLIAPLIVYWLSEKPSYTVPDCPAQQESFVIEVHPGSYIDILSEQHPQCGGLPQVCLDNFEVNNVDKQVDDYYQLLFYLIKKENANVRIIPAVDLVQDKFHYFYVSLDKLPIAASSSLLTGCATEILTKNQTIYQVESILSGIK